MRGCFRIKQRLFVCWRLFPAHAGVFPSTPAAPAPSEAFPRACGGVSHLAAPLLRRAHFSPRMRGCFSALVRLRLRNGLFPAHAGVFLLPGLPPLPLDPFPRACGGVSEACARSIPCPHFSPRMRGCFLISKPVGGIVVLFPAHAGVFLGFKPALRRSLTFPRACGGVSHKLCMNLRKGAFSPRMRGCF